MSSSIDPTNPAVCPECGAPLSDAAGGLCPRCILAEAAQPTDAPSSVHGAEPPPQADVAAAFPQFEIAGLIGTGGMGTVWKARQPTLNRHVALKLLPASLAERDPAFTERFAREGQLLARLHHPNIVAVHDSGRAGDFFYLVMEFVDGVNLRQAMRASRFTPQQALAIVPKICDALQYAHDEGVLHRDIKPENILLDARGRVKLVDFGIAKLIAQPEDATGGGPATAVAAGGSITLGDATLGTPNYMAPEQIEHPSDVDNRADIYSLGVVFYELLTGELPQGKFAPPSAKSDADPRLDGIVRQALEKERDRRQQSVGEMRTQVETITGDARAASDQAADATQNGSRFSRAAIIGACWVLTVPLMVVAWVSIMSENPYRHEIPWYVFEPGQSLKPWVMAVVLILFPLGITAPFGMTVLGWIAVTQIRRSTGKLYGLWLAVFDGLLFPLLALDGLIGWLLKSLTQLFLEFYANEPMRQRALSDPEHIHLGFVTRLANALAHHELIVTFVLIVAAIVVDYFFIRAVWRAVNRNATGAVPLRTTDSPLPWRRLAFGLIILLVVGFISLLMLGGWAMFEAIRRPAAKRDAAMSHAVRSPFPKGATLIRNNHSVMVQHDDVDLHYVFSYAGIFGTITGGSQDGHSGPWTDEGSITLKGNRRTFGYHRGSDDPTHLRVNGQEYDLRQGRVLVLHDDGSVAQLPLSPPLVVANDPPALARLIAEHVTTLIAKPSFAPVIEREVDGAIDFDSGKVVAEPEKFSESNDIAENVLKAVAWLEHEGMDALTEPSQSLKGVNLKAKSVGNDAWDHLTPDQVMATLEMTKRETWQDLDPNRKIDEQRKKPATWVFETREGGKGILQVLEDSGKDVKVCYKLVQRQGNTEASPQPQPSGALARTQEQGLSFVNLLFDHKYASAVAEFDERMRAAMPEPRLAAFWEKDFLQYNARGGKFKGANYGAAQTVKEANGYCCIVPFHWETATVNLEIHFNGSGEVSGINAAPAAPQRIEDSKEHPGSSVMIPATPGNPSPVTATFGPVIERVVTNMIDFDTGALIDFPMATQPDERDDARLDWINGQNVPDGKVPNKESYPWMRAHGVDAVEINHDLENMSLMLVARLEDRDWNSLTSAGEKKLRALTQPGAATESINGLGTYGFETREGNSGIVQIIDQHLPRGVKLRYKLVQGAETKTTAAEKPAASLAFGPVTNGLQAAAEVTPDDPFQVHFHIRNVSKETFVIASENYRQDDECILEDEQGHSVEVEHIFDTVVTFTKREMLEPGKALVLSSGGLSFLPGGARWNHPTLQAKDKPGRYTLRFRVSFGGDEPLDWKGTLETGPVTIEVKEPSVAVQNYLERTLAHLQETKAKLAALPAKTGVTEDERKTEAANLESWVKADEEEEARLLDLIQKAAPTAAKPKPSPTKAVTATGSLEAATSGTATKWVCRAAVAEADITSVAVGQEVSMTVDAFPKRAFQGRVAQVGNTPVTVQNFVTYETVIDLANPEPGFKEGMTVNVMFMVTRPASPNAADDDSKSRHKVTRAVMEAELQQARAAVARQEKSYQAGMSGATELQAAKDRVEILEAELTGDDVHVAKVRLTIARRRLESAAAGYKAGPLSMAEYEQAEGEVAITEAKLHEAGKAPQPAAAIADPLPAIELKVAQQQLEKTLNDLQETQTALAMQREKRTESNPEVKQLRSKLSALEEQAARLRERIQQNALKQ